MRKDTVKATRQVRLPFGTGQVLAILAGTKDVTRRPVRDRMIYLGAGHPREADHWGDASSWGVVSPVGDFLTLAPGDPSDDAVIRSRYRAGEVMVGTETWRPEVGGGRHWIEYRADSSQRLITHPDHILKIQAWWDRGKRGWRPSRFMPTWAARIRTPILDARPERLQAIDPADVLREGIGWETADREIFPEPVGYFGHCWDLLYGAEYPFCEDHWCNRIQFKPLKGGMKCQS